MKKETQIKLIETAINGAINGLFGKLNDGPNFDYLKNYKTTLRSCLNLCP